MKNKLLSKKSPIKFEKFLCIPFVFMLIMVLSCSKTQNESISEANLSTSTGIANAPTESGFLVYRYPADGWYAFTLADRKSNLTATIGWSDIPPIYCNGEGVPSSQMTINDVLMHGDLQSWADLLQGEAPIYVLGEYREFNDFDSWCPIFNEAPLLAVGMASITITDVAITEPNLTVNTTVVAKGQLISPENEVKQFEARVLFAWRKGDENKSLLEALVSQTIQLH